MVYLRQIVEAFPARLARCVPGGHDTVKAIILSSDITLYKHQIQPQGSLLVRSALLRRENGSHAHQRRIMGGWNDDDSV